MFERGKLLHRILTIVRGIERPLDFSIAESTPHQYQVGFVVVGEQDLGIGGDHGAFRRVIQNVLPWPGVESMPALPSIRSAALRTIARPTPVPRYSCWVGRR